MLVFLFQVAQTWKDLSDYYSFVFVSVERAIGGTGRGGFRLVGLEDGRWLQGLR